MSFKPLSTLALACAAVLGFAAPAQAQVSGDVIRIGFITDLSGVYADHQNKPDVAASKAREWFDTNGVDVLIAGTNSGTNLAMAKVAAEKHKIVISVGGGTSALTNEQCAPTTIHWAYDTTALAKGLSLIHI